MEKNEELVVSGRVEIDMRRPFSSVKEAVMLFGESVLVGEIYGNRLKEMQIKASENVGYQSRIKSLEAELEDAKQSLKKAKQEGEFMAYYLKSLKQEVEETKRELKQLKARETHNSLKDEFEIHEEIKLNPTRTIDTMDPQREDDDEFEFQHKRSVKFASSPLLTKVIVSKNISEVQVGQNSLKKKTKGKNLFPFFGGIVFSRKKGVQEGNCPKA